MIDSTIMDDINLARESILNSNNSVVVVKNGIFLSKKEGNGIKPIIETIQELKNKIHGSIIGDKILGKASALLCVYCKTKGVYSPQSTKKAISILSKHNIVYKTDKIIPFIKNKYGDDVCPFEKMIEKIELPIEAYKILKQNIIK
jgi:hypothetical protein